MSIKKKTILYTILIAILAFVLLSCNEETYTKARLSYASNNYSNAYILFKAGVKDEHPIRDYYLYYAGRSALKLFDFTNASNAFDTLHKTETNSILRAKANQYLHLCRFVLDGFPTEKFFRGKHPYWLKKFIAPNAAYIAQKKGLTNIASNIYYTMIDAHTNTHSAIRFRTYFISDKILENADKYFSNRFIYNLALALDDGGRISDFYELSKHFKNDKTKEEEYLFRLGNYFYKKKSYAKAEKTFSEYMQKHLRRKARALYMIAEVNRKRRYYSRAIEYYNKYRKLYPDSFRSSMCLRRIIEFYLLRDDFNSAKTYISILYPKYAKTWNAEVAVRNYLRYAFLNNKKEETLSALEMLKGMLIKSSRADYYRSWALYVNKRYKSDLIFNNSVKDVLLNTKNPYYLKEALQYADSDMISMIYETNRYHFQNASRHYATNNVSNALDSLYKIQFLASVIENEESDFLKRCRAFMNILVKESDFGKLYYANLNLNELATNIVKVSDYHGKKIIALYTLNDFDNMYAESYRLYKTNRASYPLFRAVETALKHNENYGTLMRLSLRLPVALGYRHYDDVLILPDDFRQYLYPKYFEKYVSRYSKKYSINPHFVYSIMREESHFAHEIESWAGAAGLMQLMPGTATWMNNKYKYNFKPVDRKDPNQNIAFGTGYIHYLSKRFDTNYYVAAAGYNAGHGAAQIWLDRYGTNNPYYYTRMIAFPETERYVQKVMKSYFYYNLIYKDESKEIALSKNSDQ